MQLTLNYIPRPVPRPGALFRGRRVEAVTWLGIPNQNPNIADILRFGCITGLTLTLAPPHFETVFDAPSLFFQPAVYAPRFQGSRNVPDKESDSDA
jgi:hypothetical protein